MIYLEGYKYIYVVCVYVCAYILTYQGVFWKLLHGSEQQKWDLSYFQPVTQVLFIFSVKKKRQHIPKININATLK